MSQAKDNKSVLKYRGYLIFLSSLLCILLIGGSLLSIHQIHRVKSLKKILQNYNYILQNHAYIFDNHLDSRILPHKIDTIDRLKKLQKFGFKSFELDLTWNPKENAMFIGHGSENLTGSAKDYFKNINLNTSKKIWLDIKEMRKDNYKNILNFLNTIPRFKDIAIVESSVHDDFFKEFKQEGYYTSFYLPTDMKDKFKTKSDSNLDAMAKKIAKQVKRQHVSSVSFDTRVYPFVKKYLEKYLSNKIDYNVWKLAPKYYINNNNLSEILANNKIFLDKRVKTILLKLKF